MPRPVARCESLEHVVEVGVERAVARLRPVMDGERLVQPLVRRALAPGRSTRKEDRRGVGVRFRIPPPREARAPKSPRNTSSSTRASSVSCTPCALASTRPEARHGPRKLLHELVERDEHLGRRSALRRLRRAGGARCDARTMSCAACTRRRARARVESAALEVVRHAAGFTRRSAAGRSMPDSFATIRASRSASGYVHSIATKRSRVEASAPSARSGSRVVGEDQHELVRRAQQLARFPSAGTRGCRRAGG